MPSLRCRAATPGPRDPTCSPPAALGLAAATPGGPARAATAGPRDPTCSTLAALVLAAATAGVPASAAPARPVAASVVSATVARRRRADRAAHPCALAAPRARRALSDRWRAPSRRIWWL